MKHLMIGATFCYVIFTSGCSTPPVRDCSNADDTVDAQRRIAALQVYKRADPHADVADAIRRSDFRFLAVLGFTWEVPGIPDFKERFAKQYSYRFISGSSELVDGPAEVTLQLAAIHYASQYNRLLLRHLLAQ